MWFLPFLCLWLRSQSLACSLRGVHFSTEYGLLLFTVAVHFTTCFIKLTRNESLPMHRGDGKTHLQLFSNTLCKATPATTVNLNLKNGHAVKVWNTWSLQVTTSQRTINHWLTVTEQAATLSSTYSEFKGQLSSAEGQSDAVKHFRFAMISAGISLRGLCRCTRFCFAVFVYMGLLVFVCGREGGSSLKLLMLAENDQTLLLVLLFPCFGLPLLVTSQRCLYQVHAHTHVHIGPQQ